MTEPNDSLFDAQRAGMTVGEGAGFFLLESAPSQPAIVAEVLGTGMSCDAYHATSPHPEGTGAGLAMRRALQDAGVDPSAIDYVSGRASPAIISLRRRRLLLLRLGAHATAVEVFV